MRFKMSSRSNKISGEKQFVTRNSPLIDLFEDKHIRTVYNIFLAIFVGLFANTAAYDYVNNAEVTLGLKLIQKGFGKFHIAILAWLAHFLLTCCIFFLFQIWARSRNFTKLRHTKIWDCFWLLLLALYYVGSFKLAETVSTKFKLPIASAAVVVIEQVRLLMKIHSFIRTNAARVIKHKSHDDAPLSLPTASHFLYFLFVPTLLYRDTYPRKERINWNFIIFRFLECIGVVFFLSFVTDRFLNPQVRDFGIRKYQLKEIVLILFGNTITGMFVLLPIFFIILHSCQNLFAEMTRFGDRLFYSDWWTCTDYAGYLRKWNIVVQEWLLVYVYKEFRSFGASSGLAKFAVYFISALVHEWCLIFILGFFFPLLFVEFLVFGSLLSLIRGPKSPLFNVLFWYSLSFGMSTLVTMYGIEYYARMNVPMQNPTFVDNLFPRFLTCDCIE